MEFNEVLEKPSTEGMYREMILCLGPVCIAFFVGFLVGRTWKLKWDSFNFDKEKLVCFNSKFSGLSSPSSSITSPVKGFGSSSACDSWADNAVLHKQPALSPADDCSTSQRNEVVNEEDLLHLWKLVEMKDGGPNWTHMMDRSTPTMSYQAWRRDSKCIDLRCSYRFSFAVKNAPPQYCSRTVFEDVTPEMVRDFFWDDDFRPKWDDMLAYHSTLEECPTTGTMIVHWIRKFPFFCSDREYIIGRRIWELGRSYYCVTKGVPYDSIPRRDKPRRVDLFYSSWCIRAAESRKGNGEMTACEVILFHHEDMGIPYEIAKLGIRQGMWGAVKKIDPGLRAYQKERASGALLSRPAMMAQINTKIDPEHLITLQGTTDISKTNVGPPSDKAHRNNIPKLMIIGGAVMLACSLDRGLLPKAFIFGMARRFANMGKRL